MHPNPAFRGDPAETNLAFARTRGFGTLCLNGPEGPMLSHVPFVLNADGTEAEMHLVRSNPIARAVTGPTRAVLAVTGPDGYVSPDWYDAPDQVPTWNYVAVHLRGPLSPPIPRTSAPISTPSPPHFENRLPRPRGPPTR
jgi:transcriptional regulator